MLTAIKFLPIPFLFLSRILAIDILHGCQHSAEFGGYRLWRPFSDYDESGTQVSGGPDLSIAFGRKS